MSADRRRCSARAFLQLDHAEPRALGGSGDTTNVRVLCAAHNRWRAEQTFGKAHVEAKIHFRQRRQRKCESDQTYTKLLSGLTGLYFRPKPARAALDLMQSGGSQVAWTDPMDSLLVAAIQLLTK